MRRDEEARISLENREDESTQRDGATEDGGGAETTCRVGGDAEETGVCLSLHCVGERGSGGGWRCQVSVLWQVVVLRVVARKTSKAKIQEARRRNLGGAFALTEDDIVAEKDEDIERERVAAQRAKAERRARERITSLED